MQSELIKTSANVNEDMNVNLSTGNSDVREEFMDDPVAKAYSANGKFYNRLPATQTLLIKEQQSVTDNVPQLDIFNRLIDDKAILQDRNQVKVIQNDLPGGSQSGYIHQMFEKLQS